MPGYIEILATELGAPPASTDAEGAALESVSTIFNNIAAGLQQSGTNFSAQAAAAQAQANAWAKVNSTFTPSNPVEANMLKVGQQIQQGLQNAANTWSSASVNSTAASAALKSAAKSIGAIAGLAEMAVAAASGSTAAIGNAASGALGGLLGGVAGAALGGAVAALLALSAPISLTVGLAAALFAGYFGSKAGSAAWKAGNFGDANIWDMVSDFFSAGQRSVPRRDPLTLDLDGDGLETAGVSSTSPILFDHDGDGIKSGTGWVLADDGLLVWDKNGNGQIDSGRELFGDAFIKPDSTLAKDGFDALATLDTNSDGKFDALDAQFNTVRIWQDANQDGVSQSGELKTLASLGIASLNVAKTANSQTLLNGNQIADLGTYTRSACSNGTLGDVSQLADINPTLYTFHREFPNICNFCL